MSRDEDVAPDASTPSRASVSRGTMPSITRETLPSPGGPSAGTSTPQPPLVTSSLRKRGLPRDEIPPMSARRRVLESRLASDARPSPRVASSPTGDWISDAYRDASADEPSSTQGYPQQTSPSSERTSSTPSPIRSVQITNAGPSISVRGLPVTASPASQRPVASTRSSYPATLEPSSGSAPALSASTPRPRGSLRATPTPAPVGLRERLLGRDGAPASAGPFTRDPSTDPKGSKDGVRLERGKSPAHHAAGTVALSPRMTALFGGLFGLATATTIVALLIQGAPPRDDRSAVSAALSASAAPSAGASAATAAAGPKKRVRTKLPGPWRIGDQKDASTKIVTDTMGRRSFITALTDKGVPKEQVYRLLKAFDGVHSFDKTGKNDKFIAALDRKSNEVKAFEFVISPTEIYQARETDGVLSASQLDMKLAEEEVSGSFVVTKDIARSIEWAGFEPDLLRAIDEAYGGRFSHESMKEGGVVRVIAVEQTVLGDFAKYKSIVAVEYQPPEGGGDPIFAYTYQGASAKGYFDERGRQPDGSGWTSPVPGAPITSRFNPKRMHPVLHKIMPHTGTDFGATTGTPVQAVYRGKVTHAGPAGPCGLMVAIMHPNGVESGYCHLSKIAPNLKVGDAVGARQNIGQVGTTGRSTGPHLHFWTKRNGTFFDSQTMKIDGFRVLPADERDAFTARKAELEQRLAALPTPEPPPVEAPVKPAPAVKDNDDDTRPQIGDSGEGDETAAADAPPKKGGSSAKPAKDPATAAPSVDSGDDEDLVGPDLK
ncbi:MAG: peptidoglycan DD-metalloendopeptidase family protein [Polyangiaceae bacterium]